MKIGWIDFSNSERNKVLNVLASLSEQGTLDELGIAPIRDGFSNIFFPGTSTIQTRAKYFLIVPYVLNDIERRKETNYRKALSILDSTEEQCAKILIANGEDTDRVIGIRSLRQKKWVKRTPASIYWSGLRTYGILKAGDISLTQFADLMCRKNKQYLDIKKIGHYTKPDENVDTDDKDAGNDLHIQFWNLPKYPDNWQETLDINLTKEEGAFLKERIIASCGDSMLANILQNKNIKEIIACESFENLGSLIKDFPEDFPEKLRDDYYLAYDFSNFVYVLRILYNIIVSAGKNKEANEKWEEEKPHIYDYAKSLELKKIFERLNLIGHTRLYNFLNDAQKVMQTGLLQKEDYDKMINLIISREVYLKHEKRAKTIHPGEFDPNIWFGGKKLDYRFKRNGIIIVKDIYESESGGQNA